MAKPEFKTRCAKLQSIVHWITGVGAEITMVWSRRNQFSHGRDIKKYISRLVLKMWIACDRKEPHVFSLRLLWNTIFSWDRLFGDCCWWDNSWGLIIGCFFSFFDTIPCAYPGPANCFLSMYSGCKKNNVSIYGWKWEKTSLQLKKSLNMDEKVKDGIFRCIQVCPLYWDLIYLWWTVHWD